MIFLNYESKWIRKWRKDSNYIHNLVFVISGYWQLSRARLSINLRTPWINTWLEKSHKCSSKLKSDLEEITHLSKTIWTNPLTPFALLPRRTYGCIYGSMACLICHESILWSLKHSTLLIYAVLPASVTRNYLT